MTLFKKSNYEMNDKDSPEDHYIKRVLLTELIAQSESKKKKSISDQIKLRNLKRTYSLLYPFECSTPYCNKYTPKTTELVKQSIDLGVYPPQLKLNIKKIFSFFLFISYFLPSRRFYLPI